MNFDFADILLAVLEHNASDLHVTAGATPTIRVRGRLKALDDFPKLSTQDTRELIYGILNDDQRARFERAAWCSSLARPARASRRRWRRCSTSSTRRATSTS